MIDSIYKTVQGILNKDQLGYLKPIHFNSFIANAQRKIYNDYLTDLKSNIRRSNWMLDGKNLANLSAHTKQLVEYFSYVEPEINSPTSSTGDNPLTTYILPNDLEYIEDVFSGNTRIEKVDYADFKDLQRSIYAKPSDCSPVCSKVGDKLRVASNNISSIELHYLRKPKTPKWTFEPDGNNKPMFDPTKNDFQDVDMPEEAYDRLISLVSEMASLKLRQFNITQAMNQEQQQDAQTENKQ